MTTNDDLQCRPTVATWPMRRLLTELAWARPPRAPYPMCAACTTNTGAPARSPRQGGRRDWQRVVV